MVTNFDQLEKVAYSLIQNQTYNYEKVCFLLLTKSCIEGRVL